MSEYELFGYKKDANKLKDELKAGNITSDNCSIIIKRIMVLNEAIDGCRAYDARYFDLVDCCYSYYRMLDEYYY